jgi:hypothetical protein
MPEPLFKPLNSVKQAELQIAARFVGTSYAFVPVRDETHDLWRLGIAVEGERGYTPLPVSAAHASDFHAMQDEADRLNRDVLCLDHTRAAEIVGSSARTAPA